MTNEEVRSLHRILDYLKEEEKHFEDCSPEEKPGHIFNDVLVLLDFEKRVNRHNNRLAERNMELLLFIKDFRAACRLAYIHLKNCNDKEEESAESGAEAMTAIQSIMKETVFAR